MGLTSCTKEKTYAEQRERELDNISAFIAKNNIKVISEKTFKDQGYTTESDQYVLFNNSGVYMNIVEKGPSEGKVLSKSGDRCELLVRYSERNLNGDSIQSTNLAPLYATLPDKISVRNNSGTFIAQFIYGRMLSYYGSKSVPGGWLVPLNYIRLGRIIHPINDSDVDEAGNLIVDSRAIVRLIVPHDQGTARATSGVYACFYYLEYELDI